MNEDGRKGLKFPQHREKHGYTFGHPAGQSSWSCKVIFAGLRNKVRRVRHDLNVLLFIYILFHLSVYIMGKKMIGGYSPSQKSAILTSSVFALWPTVIFPGSRSQLFRLPFYLCYTADIFAQYLLVCPALFGLATDHVYLDRYHYHYQSFLIH